MAFNGSGTFVLYSPGNPVVTGTTISSTWANNTLNDIATGLSTCITKDGQTTPTANLPMGGFKLTGLAAGASNGDSLRYEQLVGQYIANSLLTTRGDMIRRGASAPERFALGASGTVLQSDGTDPVWGTLSALLPSASTSTAGIVELLTQAEYDAGTDTTRVPTANLNRIALGTEQSATTTAVDFTGIPSGVRRITINFVGVSTNGSSSIIVQMGDSGGIENSGYLGAGSYVGSGGSGASNFTNGFGLPNIGSTNALHGSVTLVLEDAANFHWCATGALADSSTSFITFTAGAKATSSELDRVRITMANGTDSFDAGSFNITYER